MNEWISARRIRGEARLFRVPADWRADDCRLPRGPFSANLVMYDWATIVANLLRNNPNGKPHHISAVYLEFENNSGVAVDPPTYSRSGGVSYYNSLSSHPTRDYLRVALTASSADSSDVDLFPGGNRPSFFAQTEGVAGVHGKEFSAVEQSRVFGAALVATPDFDDPTQDLVFSRFYYSDPDQQLIKAASSQIGLQWRLQLE